MIEVTLPADDEESRIPEVVRSFAACLAAVTHTPIRQVPLPDSDLGGAIAHWRSWLAGRGAGLVPIARPAGFAWPGYWLAVLDADERTGSGSQTQTAVLLFGTPSGVVLSPQDGDLLGVASVDLPVREGYLVGILDPALDEPHRPAATLRGTAERIALTAAPTEPMRVVEAARALPGRGLEGDRYAAKAGTFTPADPQLRGYDLTLVAAEVLDELRLPDGAELPYEDARRNVVTRGIDVNALIGRRFRIGDVECLGQRMCEPCSHLERLTHHGVLRGLIHRGGLRADVLTDGTIRAGDTIETID